MESKEEQDKRWAEAWNGGPRFGPTAAQAEAEARWNPNWERNKEEKDLRSEIYETERRLKLLKMKYKDKGYGELE